MGETKGERKQLAIKNNNLSKFKGKAFCKRILIIKIYQSCKKKKKCKAGPGTLLHCWWEVKWCSHLENSLAGSSKGRT